MSDTREAPDIICPICGMPACERKHKGALGWALITAVVVAWDVAGPETLSAAFLRHRTHPLTLIAWGGLTAHLFGIIPRRYDPLCRGFDYAGTRLYRR